MEELKAVISLLQEELKEEESSREVEEGVGFELKDSIDLPEGLPSKDEVKNYIKKHSGATVKVLEHINLGVTG